MGAALCRPEAVDYDRPADLYHFQLLRSIGKGAFGKVQIVQHKPSKTLYALKYINKQKCVKMKAVTNIVQERKLLEEIDHTFVVNMRYAFQDDHHCFLVLDLMLGGDLRYHLERNRTVAEPTVRIWVAEIASALSYLHERKIMHRDIKPDNILLDAGGHTHITDFNIATHYREGKKHSSIAGSMAYMAPEILARKGYTCHIDWWSLGVCAYELVFGRRPFRGKSNQDLIRAIVRGGLKFPDEAASKCTPEGQAALKAMIERSTRKRLGCIGSDPVRCFVEFKRHPWFRGLDWELLAEKQVETGCKVDESKSNCSPDHELERILLDDDQLRARKRNPKRTLESLSPELRMLEMEFTPYDFGLMNRRTYQPEKRNEPPEPHQTVTSSSGGAVSSRPETPTPDDELDESEFFPRIVAGTGGGGERGETVSFAESRRAGIKEGQVW